MKNTILILAVLILVAGSSQLSATIYFDDGQHHFINEMITEDVVVRDGSFWGNPTTVVFGYDAFLTDDLSVYGNSRVEVDGGYIYGIVIADNNSQIYFRDGIIGQDLHFEGGSCGIIRDGYIKNLHISGNGRIDVLSVEMDRVYCNNNNNTVLFGLPTINEYILINEQGPGSMVVFLTPPLELDGEPVLGIVTNPFPWLNYGHLTYADIEIEIRMAAGTSIVFANHPDDIPPRCTNRHSADLTGDCRVDIADFAIIASQWLQNGLEEGPLERPFDPFW